MSDLIKTLAKEIIKEVEAKAQKSADSCIEELRVEMRKMFGKELPAGINWNDAKVLYKAAYIDGATIGMRLWDSLSSRRIGK